MSELTIEQAIGSLNEIVKVINNRCGGVVLDGFRLCPQHPNTSSSSLFLHDTVYINIREMPSCKKHILERTIEANHRMIDLLNDTNQKLEELKKELKHG